MTIFPVIYHIFHEHSGGSVPLPNPQLPARSCRGPGCGTAARWALRCRSAGAEPSAAPEAWKQHWADTANTVNLIKVTQRERDQQGFNTLPALPLCLLQHLKGLSEHEANQLLQRNINMFNAFHIWHKQIFQLFVVETQPDTWELKIQSHSTN